MSVLACDRVDCPHIMCQRLILQGHAYICEDCWQELLAYRSDWPATMTVAEVRERIENFMRDTPPGTFSSIRGVDIDAEFQRLTVSEP